MSPLAAADTRPPDRAGAGADGHDAPALAAAQATLADVAGRVKAQAARAEDQFLSLGSQLSSVAMSLSGLVSACERVAQEATASETTAAAEALRSAAAQIRSLAGPGVRREALGQLLERLDVIGRRIEHAQSALRPASAIALGAKVEAARIGDEDLGFGDFAAQISEAFGLALDTLTAVAEEAGTLRLMVQHACGRDAELTRRMELSMAQLSTRISSSVEEIVTHTLAAGRAAETTAAESRAIGVGVGNAVAATQVGDAARQRMEHVGDGLEAAIAACRAERPEAGPSAVERRGLLACAGELAAAQLADTAEELLADMGRVLASLRGLGAAAENLAGVGAGLGRGAGAGESTIADLRAGVAEAQVLFSQLEAAWRDADELAAAVAQSARRLERRIGTIRSAEAQVSRLAMNASIKCGRVGERGRALAVIALQLQSCVDQTTCETAGIVEGLGQVLALAEHLAGCGDGEAGPALARVGESFDQALEPLAALEARMCDSLAVIGQESLAVARSLQTTASDLAVHEEVAALLQAGAAELEAVALETRRGGAEDGPATERFLSQVAASYTMARERTIHAAVLGGASGPADRLGPEGAR